MVKLPAALQGEVWLAALDPTLGNEIHKTRPCLVVSPDGMNRFLGTVIVMPLTSGSRPARFRPSLTFAGKTGLLLGDQIRGVSKQRLIKKVGVVDESTLMIALRVLTEMFEVN